MDSDVTVSPKGGRAYPVLFGGPERAEEWLTTGTVCLVGDDEVARHHADAVAAALGSGKRVLNATFPAGEEHKTRATKEKLEDSLIAAGVDRSAVVIGLGGGVSTDLAGFVASTLFRGVAWIAMPSSLLAMVDAAVGGKTGVNTAAGKNLVGTFHHPIAVIVNLDFLKTLPPAQVDNGLAEMLKHAIVADADHFEKLISLAPRLRDMDPDALRQPLGRSIEIKADVVSKDPGESNLRAVLNFGHTIGHAIEKVSGYAVSHGHAVAAGIAVESAIAVRLGLLPTGDRDRIWSALETLKLPRRPDPSFDPVALVGATAVDKKGRDGRARYVLPTRIGEMACDAGGYLREVPENDVLAALDEVHACFA